VGEGEFFHFRRIKHADSDVGCVIAPMQTTRPWASGHPWTTSGEAAMTETIPVEYRVLGVERAIGTGRLLALANVEIDVAGVVLRLQGVQVRRGTKGLECSAPVWRHPHLGRWLPAVTLPPELLRAIAVDVLDAFNAIYGFPRNGTKERPRSLTTALARTSLS
jgi:hypothetical protein